MNVIVIELNRAEFAEVADALGCNTSEIFSAMRMAPGMFDVIYTPGVTEDNIEHVSAYRVGIERGVDGILHRTTVDTEIPFFFEKIKASVDRVMEAMTKEDDDGAR